MPLHTGSFPRPPFVRVAAIAFLLFVFLAGCAGQVPTPEEIAEDEHESQYAQIMRIANSTRAGGDLSGAGSFYQRAHALAPERSAPLIALGEISAALGAYEESAKAYRSALTIDADDAKARQGYGKVLIALNRPDRAAHQFRAAIDLDAGDYRSYNGLGVALDLVGKHEQAQQSYVDGMEKAPDNPSLRNNLALSLALARNYDEAVDILREIAGDPIAGRRVRQNLALVYGLAGKIEKAAAVASMDLKDDEVRNNLAYYQSLHKLSGRALAEAVLGVQTRGGNLPPDTASEERAELP